MLRELARIAADLPAADFDRDVLPRLRRLTADQRAQVRAAWGRLLSGAPHPGAGESAPP
jgi:hypothetical protein